MCDTYQVQVLALGSHNAVKRLHCPKRPGYYIVFPQRYLVFASFDINIKRFVDRSVWYITKDHKLNDQGAFVMKKRIRRNLGVSGCGDCCSRWSSGRVENSQFITHGNQELCPDRNDANDCCTQQTNSL